MIIFNRRALAVTGAAMSMALLASPATAGTTPAVNMGISAQVNATCSVSVSNVGFGPVSTISGAAVDASGGITVTCTNGSPWAASAGLGNGTGATFAARKMQSGSNLMTYSLYTDASRATVWGDGSTGNVTITGTGTGTAQSVTVYGRVAAGQTSLPAGTYTDSVSVTVTY